MRFWVVLPAVVMLAGIGCYRSPDPRVRAAEDFRDTVFSLISEDEAQTKRLNGLRVGMSDQEVLNAAGAPTERKSETLDEGRAAEVWTYNGQLTTLGTLTFENGKLSNVQTY